MATTDGVGRQIIIAGLGIIDPDLGDRLSYGEDLLKIWQSRSGGDELLRQAKRSEKAINHALATSFEDYDKMPSNERLAAAAAVEQILKDSRLTKEHLVEINFDARTLWEELEGGRRDSLAKAQLSSHAYAYALLLLRESCEYLVSFIRHLPEVRDQATLETFVRTHHMEQSLQLVIDDMRSRQEQNQTKQDRFLIDYRRGLLTQHGYLQLFGLNVAPEYRRQRIDVAYVTLSVTLTDKRFGSAAEDLEAHGYRAVGKELFQREGLAVDDAITSLATYREVARLRAGGMVGFRPKHLDTGLRILLVGAAGSGKSTVCQWLAVLLAKHDGRKTPSSLYGDFPFLIKLRELVRRGTVDFTDRDLIRVQGVDPSDVSDLWLEDTLRSGSALLIFDGMDELSGTDREATMLWIESLMERYPKCNIIVTSRPDDVDRARFLSSHFSLFDLAPMGWGTTTQCIDNWFEAMEGLTTPEQQSAKHLLLASLRDDPSLRQLAETPLIATMLCAIYVHDEGGSTSTRTELYERVSDVLLHRREQYRKSVTPQWENLRLRDKRLILSEVASEMQKSGSSVLPLNPSDVRYLDSGSNSPLTEMTTCLWEILDDVLPEMPGVNASSEELAEHLLNRSVLLTRITRHECQFLHRSFQEYFAALWYAESLKVLNVSTLLQSDSGRSILSFIAGAIGRSGAGTLLKALCDAHDESSPTLKRASAVLVAECFSSVVSVDMGVYKRALQVTATVVPPRSPTEAKDLSRHGGMALNWTNSWLDHNPDANGADAESLIYLCRLLGGELALKTLERFVPFLPLEPGCLDELLRSWTHFDHDDYRERVLRPFLDRRPSFVVQWPARVAPEDASELPGIQFLSFKSLDAESLSVVRRAVSLRSLSTGNATKLSSLDGVESLKRLRSLWIAAARSLVDIEALSGSSMWDLSLKGASSLINASALAGLPLRSLELEDARRIEEWGFVLNLFDLRSLRLKGSTFTDGSLLSGLSALRVLDLSECVVANLQSLDRLNLTALGAPLNLRPGGLSKAHPLRILVVKGHWEVDDLLRISTSQSMRTLNIEELGGGGVGAAFPALEYLRIERSEEVAGLFDLDLPHTLKSLELASPSLEYLDGIESCVNLTRLDLRGSSGVLDMMPLLSLPNLRWLGLDSGQNELLYTMDWPGRTSVEVVASEWWAVGQDVG